MNMLKMIALGSAFIVAGWTTAASAQDKAPEKPRPTAAKPVDTKGKPLEVTMPRAKPIPQNIRPDLPPYHRRHVTKPTNRPTLTKAQTFVKNVRIVSIDDGVALVRLPSTDTPVLAQKNQAQPRLGAFMIGEKKARERLPSFVGKDAQLTLRVDGRGKLWILAVDAIKTR